MAPDGSQPQYSAITPFLLMSKLRLGQVRPTACGPREQKAGLRRHGPPHSALRGKERVRRGEPESRRAGEPAPVPWKLCRHRHSEGRGQGPWDGDRPREEEGWGQAGAGGATRGQSELTSAKAVSGGSPLPQPRESSAQPAPDSCSVRAHVCAGTRTHARLCTPQVVTLLTQAIDSALACPPAEKELSPSVTRGPLRAALALSQLLSNPFHEVSFTL